MLRRQLDRIEASGTDRSGRTGGGNGTPPVSPDTDIRWKATVDSRLARVDGALEGLKASIDGTRWVVGIVAVILIGGFSFLGFQLNRMEYAVSALPTRLSDEFHSMRSEMAAQVSAISNAITATRQAQPAQIMVLPSPSTSAKPEDRKP